MKIVKDGKHYIVIVERKDGTTNNYRFNTKREAVKWIKERG